MTIDEAKYVSEWNKNPRKAVWHPDTEEAMDWLIETNEKLVLELSICNESERMLEGEKQSAFAQLTTEQRHVESLLAKLSDTGAPEGPL